jgi:hypothetical protein
VNVRGKWITQAAAIRIKIGRERLQQSRVCHNSSRRAVARKAEEIRSGTGRTLFAVWLLQEGGRPPAFGNIFCQFTFQ